MHLRQGKIGFEISLIVLNLLLLFSVFCAVKDVFASDSDDWSRVPVKGMVTMIDLGADSCVPCKMMAPVLEKVEKDFKGKAAIIIIDVWKYRGQAQRFGIRAIPTQIFFNKEGREVYRHTGFMAEAAIVAQLRKLGVE